MNGLPNSPKYAVTNTPYYLRFIVFTSKHSYRIYKKKCRFLELLGFTYERSKTEMHKETWTIRSTTYITSVLNPFGDLYKLSKCTFILCKHRCLVLGSYRHVRNQSHTWGIKYSTQKNPANLPVFAHTICIQLLQTNFATYQQKIILLFTYF